MVRQTLAHCKILKKFGSGGMGDVYLAEDTKLDRKVALKVLPAELAESEQRRARFQREAKAIAALDHPNICKSSPSKKPKASTSSRCSSFMARS